MAKITGMTTRERKLAERIAGGTIPSKGKLTDKQALAFGFILERRTNPTTPLVRYLRTANADDVRATLDPPDPAK